MQLANAARRHGPGGGGTEQLVAERRDGRIGEHVERHGGRENFEQLTAVTAEGSLQHTESVSNRR